MRYFKSFIIFFMAMFVACVSYSQSTDHTHTQPVKVDTLNKKSIPQEEHAQLGATHITILYSAPAVRGRIIWGGLVSYDQVWVTGAHHATSIEFDRELSIDGQKVLPGKYAIFTIPGKDKWTFILNKKWDQHLADEYDQQDDVLRFEATLRTVSELQERLTYAITELSETEAVLSISWEKVKVNIPLKLTSN